MPTQLKSGHVSSAVGPDTLSVFFLEAQPLLKINYLISLHQKGPENVAIILTNIYIYIYKYQNTGLKAKQMLI